MPAPQRDCSPEGSHPPASSCSCQAPTLLCFRLALGCRSIVHSGMMTICGLVNCCVCGQAALEPRGHWKRLGAEGQVPPGGSRPRVRARRDQPCPLARVVNRPQGCGSAGQRGRQGCVEAWRAPCLGLVWVARFLTGQV